MSEWIELHPPQRFAKFAGECEEPNLAGLQIEEPNGTRYLIGEIDYEMDDYGCGCCGEVKEYTVARYRRLVPLEVL